MSIKVPSTEALQILQQRGWAQGYYGVDGGGPVCLHGAIRLCDMQPGDAALIEYALAGVGLEGSTDWNDDDERDLGDVIGWLRSEPEVTDGDLKKAYGPQWQEIVALVRRASIPATDEADRLRVALGAARGAAWDAAWLAAEAAAQAAERDVGLDAACAAAEAVAQGATRSAVRDAATALSVRDLIGKYDGWDQEAYDLLTGPWRRAVGPIHQDDKEIK